MYGVAVKVGEEKCNDCENVLGVRVGLWSAGNTSVDRISIYCRQYRI